MASLEELQRQYAEQKETQKTAREIGDRQAVRDTANKLGRLEAKIRRKGGKV